MSDGANPELDLVTLRGRHTEIRQRIRDAGGDPDQVTVLAVTKTFPVEVAKLAAEAGLLDLGENYSQELEVKGPAVDDARWHFIGGLQRNKVRKVAEYVYLWQTIDRISLATEVAKRAPGAKVLIQVNTTGETQKSGCEPDELDPLVEHCRTEGLDLQGLMTVGPTAEVDPRPAFARLRAEVDRLDLAICSMGMSGDLEAAVAEGSTLIRIGTALFGARST